ncbi:MAG: EF-hand domain-containing protein [Cognaticolwellia sp.]
MKKLFNATPIILVLISSVTWVPAISAELPMRGPIPFSSYDQDGNGLISEPEFNQIRSERMAIKAKQGRMMKNASNAPLFAYFDQDSDGQITEQELQNGQQAQLQKRGAKGKRPKMGQGRGKGIGMNKGRNMPTFSQFDLNADGVILKQEFYDARAARIKSRAAQGYSIRNRNNALSFADIDISGDEKISLEEFTLHQNKRRQAIKQR